MTVTELRSRLYEVVDQVLETGLPQTIERRGRRLQLVAYGGPQDKFANLVPHQSIVGDPDELIDLKVGVWSEIDKI